MAALDRLLALLIAALVTTGLVTLRLGAENEAWVFVVHGVLAAALAVTVAMKLGRSLPKAIRARRWGRVAFGLVLSAATIGALVAGFAWVASGRLLTVASWTVLTLHAWIGLVLVPITILHLLPRRWRLLRLPSRRASRPAVSRGSRPLTRRQLLTAATLGGASLAIFGAAQLAETLAGGVRRFTGSRWLPAGGVPPDTTFFGEAAPPIDPATWRLRVSDGAAVDVSYDLATIRALGEADRTAVLDCTSGSFSATPARPQIPTRSSFGRRRAGRHRSTRPSSMGRCWRPASAADRSRSPTARRAVSSRRTGAVSTG